MRALRPAAILGIVATLACGSRPYNWSSTKVALDRLLPNGTPQAQVTIILDSLGFSHGPLDPKDSTITAMKREPRASDKLVFSTLRLVLKVSGDGHLMDHNTSELFTGP
jgi:hypothetical protein